MAEWSKNKVSPSSINKGQEYVKNDNVSLEELNSVVNNSFYASDRADYASDRADTAISTSNEALNTAQEALQTVVEQTGTTVTIGGINQSTWSADFAESERQKSKNWCYLTSRYTSGDGVTITVDEETQIITINGTSTAAFDRGFPKLLLPKIKNCKGKTFTALARSVGEEAHVGVYLGTVDDEQSIYDTRFADLYNNPQTFTLSDNYTYDMILIYAPKGITYNNLKIQIQIEEGTEATDWQYPYGQIVHENDIADVEHVETIYDMSSTDSNINWGYTSGIVSATTVSGKDFSKYKKVRCYFCAKEGVSSSDTFGRSLILEVDLTHFIAYGYSSSIKLQYYQRYNYICGIFIEISQNKDSLYFVVYDNEVIVEDNSHFIYMIEGVY